MNIRPLFAPAVLGMLLAACGEAPRPIPPEWAQREAVAGQPLPVPTVWLNGDPEARYTHNIKLPDSMPKPVPFDFKAAERKAWWPGSESVGIQYLRHLCATESGEWVFKKVAAQEVIYNARPLIQLPPYQDYSLLESPAAAWSSLPWDWRNEKRFAGAFLLGPPHLYDAVEEPRRELAYQAGISSRYISIRHLSNGGNEPRVNRMVQGIERPTAQYAVTWRGTVRSHDRESGINGIELIVYDRKTGEILAVRRNFFFLFEGSKKLPRACGKLTWSSQFHERSSDVSTYSVPTKSLPDTYTTPRSHASSLSSNALSR